MFRYVAFHIRSMFALEKLERELNHKAQVVAKLTTLVEEHEQATLDVVRAWMKEKPKWQSGLDGSRRLLSFFGLRRLTFGTRLSARLQSIRSRWTKK